MNYPPLIKQNNSDGGVEEKKDDDPVTLSHDHHVPRLNGLHHNYSSGNLPPNGTPYDATDPINNENSRNQQQQQQPQQPGNGGFQNQVHNFVKSIVESFENVVTFLVHGGEGGCPWPGSSGTPANAANHRPTAVVNPPLSITEELRKLAESEGRVFGGGMRRADIPRFLGEEAVYSFDDDNISAISQHTLEEMTKHGIRHPIRRKLSSESSDSAMSPQQQQLPPPLPMKVELLHGQEEREGIV